MPGNEFEDRFCNFFELNNSSLGQNPSLALGGDWSVLNYNQQVGRQGQNGAPLGFSLNNDNTQQSDSVKRNVNQFQKVPFDHTFTQVNPRPDFSGHFSRSELLNTNGYAHGRQTFQRWPNVMVCSNENTEIGWRNLIPSGLSILESHQGDASVESPTLTTNSEKSEIAEASSDINFNFPGGQQQQQLVKDQRLSASQPPPMQQSGFNDMQLLQQTIMFKQLQEMQRQQQLQQLGEARQHNSLNQVSAITKQAAGGQLPLLINGTPVRDASPMCMNLMQRSSSPVGQGVPHRQAFPQDQNQTMRTMGLASQQLDASLHGAPVGSTGGNVNQYSQMQGMSRDSVNLLNKASGNQAQKPIMQSTFGNPYPGDHGTFYSDNVCMPPGAFVSKQGFPMKNAFGQLPPQHGNFPQTNVLLPDFNGKLEQAGNLETMHHKTTQLGPSQGLVPLDPLEQKILFNMDDNSWETSFGRSMDTSAGGFGSALEQSDFSNALQSGSWSALMQSAVAEVSSSDTGVQEEWSGLTFQNTELSSDNQPSKFLDEERQQTGWANTSFQSASSHSKPFPLFNDSSMSSSFPGYQQSGVQSSNEHTEGLRQYDSHKSFQKSPRNAGEWSDSNPQQMSSNQMSQQIQPLTRSKNTWGVQNYKHPESDLHQQRMASPNNVSQLCHEQKGDNRAMDKGRDPVGYPWTGYVEELNSRTDYSKKEDSQVNHLASVPNLGSSKATDKPHALKHADSSINNNENESGGKTQNLLSSSNQTINNTYEGAGPAHENFSNSYNSKGFSGSKQGHVGQLNIIGNMSKDGMNLNQGRVPDFHGNSKASQEVVSGSDLRSNTSTSFGRTVGFHGQNVAPQTSQHMLELLHKVDRSRENSPSAHFGSTDHSSLSEVPKADAHDSYIAQLFNQSSASQGFGLKLAPPSQRLPNSSRFLPPQDSPQMVSNLNPRQVNPGFGVKNPGWLDSSSPVQSLPSNEFSPRACWDEKSKSCGRTNVSSYLNIQGPSDAALTSGLPQPMPNTPLDGESSQETLTGTSSRFPQQVPTKPFAQPFPVLENAPLSQPPALSGMSQKDGTGRIHQNAWKNVPTSRLSSAPPSIEPPKNITETTSLALQGLNAQNSQKGRTLSSDLGACSMNSQGSEYGEEEQPGKQRSKQDTSSEVLDTLQSGGLSEGQESVEKHVLSHSNQQDRDRVLHGGNHASERNLESFGRSLKASETFRHNYNLQHQMQAMKTAVDSDPSKRAVKRYNESDSVINVHQTSGQAGQQSIYEHNSRFRNQTYNGMSSLNSSLLNSFPSGDPKMIALLTNATKELGGKALSQAALQTSQGVGTLNENDSQNQLYNHTENSQVNLRMAPMWFEQYGSVRNGQLLPLYDARLAKTAMEQFTPGKSSQNLPVHTSVDQISSAVPRQVGSISPSTPASLGVTQNFSAPHVLLSDLAEQSRNIIRAKKRKTIRSERIPWHREVNQGSQRLQDISTAEQDWAFATNRLIEKVQDGFELIGEGQPMYHRSKRRLILTTQLMQQLLRPASTSILLGDASSHYDSVVYIIAKLALGDACSLAYGSKIDLHAAQGNGDMTSDELKAFESGKHFTKAVEDFTERAKKVENDFLRLESTSISDIRVDCQDLERYSVINRFAKFHMRGQADASGTSSSTTATSLTKSSPQKYVTALAMPRNLPEGAQCLSL